MGIPSAEIIELLPPGDEQPWPDKYRAWSAQEVIRICLDLGWSATELCADELASPGPGYDPIEIHHELNEYLEHWSGVAGVPGHAVAFDHGKFYDPSTGLERGQPADIHTVWILNRIDN